ncbi:trp operon leader peptide [Salmonella enterica subsp. enterica]|nr:trp operon leader peptide [Salmonella enterica]EBS4004469.1 trp operon leader peptide [Salmonella enterica subsp. enterica serovar Concord]EBU5307081.1 trp operon leader peptide [Salmonella enterica subsp. enterica]EBV1218106.1 trp operon leader peptide [Salmonella enterica subsp. enterica serovar Neunkirchen]EBY4400939.1 trp operon leader peptide [Salmonella enterica subsp. enterica serovar Caracas]EGI5613188.1 trp operon leader peptide [Salmonella enterica subsp. enterica serovar Stanley]
MAATFALYGWWRTS